MTLPIYVIANGGMFREGFNAVVTVLGESSFHTAIRLAVLFSIFGAITLWIKSHDMKVLAHWFALYFCITTVLLTPKVTVLIKDSSVPPPAPPLIVDNVPIGLAWPASLLTAIGHFMTTAFEKAYHAPDDQAYSKTGMLFGSRLFNLSSGFHFINPALNRVFNQYLDNCIDDEIRIHHSYTYNDLLHANDPWTIISAHTSPLHRILYQGQMLTCQQVTPLLYKQIEDSAKGGALKFFSRLFFGSNSSAKETMDAVAKMNHYLPLVYNYYGNLSKSASDILATNMIINGIRSGILNYASQMGATSAMINYAQTSSLQKSRVAWQNAIAKSTYTLPLFQSIFLLLALCLFPLVILLAFQPTIGTKVFKTYVMILIWLESWPLFFSVINMGMTYYIHYKTSGIADGGFTLSNLNELRLMHSDASSICGYLIASIPMLSFGLVRGMTWTFNQAVGGLNAMLNGLSTESAASVATGNISLGNTSTNNVSSNKINTNASYLHGMSTEQLSNGALQTSAHDGSVIDDASPAISRLPISIHAGSQLSNHFSQASESAKQAALQSSENYQSSISSAANQLQSFAKTNAFHQAQGNHFSVNHSTSQDQAASNLYGMVEDVMSRTGTNFHDAFSALSTVSETVGVGAAVRSKDALVGKPLKWIAGFSGNLHGSADYLHNRSSADSDSFDQGGSISISDNEAKQFRENWSVLTSYNHNQSADQNYSENNAHTSQLSADLRHADSYNISKTQSLNESSRDSELASYVKANSASIQSDFNQSFANYVRKVAPDRAEFLLTNTSNVSIAEERAVLANRFVGQQFASQIEHQFEKAAAKNNVDQFNETNQTQLNAFKHPIQSNFSKQSNHIQQQARQVNPGFSQQSKDQLESLVLNHQQHHSNKINQQGENIQQQLKQKTKTTKQAIAKGAQKSDRVSFNLGAIRPDN